MSTSSKSELSEIACLNVSGQCSENDKLYGNNKKPPSERLHSVYLL